ncbi:uncharacterized protein LOC125037511 [Penaeus chinensis]|uniref:uncharacterized protein LOC125037511 n=1 Tax=Penaeus chinensis TaxID=139456 RepID=UPI001FB832E6|nr:uncharacterized protein LOC125037511 [Penaeus chinensis]
MSPSCRVPGKKMIENIFESHLGKKTRISKDVLPLLHLQFILFLKELASISDLEAFKQRKRVLSGEEIDMCAPSLLKKYCDAKRTRPAPRPRSSRESTDSESTDSL